MYKEAMMITIFGDSDTNAGIKRKAEIKLRKQTAFMLFDLGINLINSIARIPLIPPKNQKKETSVPDEILSKCSANNGFTGMESSPVKNATKANR